MADLFDQRKAASISREAVRARTEQEAERWVRNALECLGLDDAELPALPKGAEAKLVMAWWLRRRTTMSRGWITERLKMRHESRVTLAARTLSEVKRGSLDSLRKRIARIRTEHP